MGNNSSDTVERKAFNFIKNIPGVSQIYRLPRAIVYAAKNNQTQVKRSFEYKMKDIDLFNCVRNIEKEFASLAKSYKEGIWVG